MLVLESLVLLFINIRRSNIIYIILRSGFVTNSDVYRRLQEHLDSLPVGYPATQSGVELRILKRLFTEEEAEMACFLSALPKTVQQIAKETGKAEKHVEFLLKQMSDKGLIAAYHMDEELQYANQIFAVGIYELQLGVLDKEFAEDFEEYMQEAFSQVLVQGTTPQLRVVPIQASVEPSMGVSPYENLRHLIKEKDQFSVMECICKKEKALLGEGCEKPREVCLVLAAPNYFTKKGWAREISQDEAFDILAQAEKAALVASPGNIQNPYFICLCCGCCCGILSNLKKLSNPSKYVASNFFAVVDTELCSSCETCLDRCQMDAITMIDNIANVDLRRCIGCGLCVSTCPDEAIHLKRKDPSQIVVPPASNQELYQKIATEKETSHKRR